MDITSFCENNNIPCVPDEDCKFTGEEDKPGQMSCRYVEYIKFPLMKEPYAYVVWAQALRKRIPLTSN